MGTTSQIEGLISLVHKIKAYCQVFHKRLYSSNINEVIRAVLNHFLRKDSAKEAPKTQRRNQAKIQSTKYNAQNANKQTGIKNALKNI